MLPKCSENAHQMDKKRQPEFREEKPSKNEAENEAKSVSKGPQRTPLASQSDPKGSPKGTKSRLVGAPGGPLCPQGRFREHFVRILVGLGWIREGFC